MTRSQRKQSFVVLLVVLATGIGFWLTSRRTGEGIATDRPVESRAVAIDTSQIQKPPAPDEGFIGSMVCGECHPSIADSYRSHPMSRSLTAVGHLVAADNELRDQLVEPPGPRKYRVRYDGSRLWHAEFLPGPDGVPIYDQEVEITLALGSGTRGRAYLLEREGRLFASPLNWYARTQKWDLAPGYSPRSHIRFERETGQGCLMCHAGRTNEIPSRPNVYSKPMFVEAAIGCEQCHGPGQRHVDFHSVRKQQRTGDDDDVDPIVNPSKLDVARREAVCNQCHLQGRAQHLRYGRHLSDFRPGMRLEDVWLIFVSEEHVSSKGRTQAVSQVQQMRSSTCYSQSGGRLGCISCHDAHSAPASSDRADFYRQRCLSCHAETEAGCALSEMQRLFAPEANSCIACHMPSLGTDIPHTSQTDHRVLRRPEKNQNERSVQPRNANLVFFDGADQRIPEWEVHRGRGLMLAGLAERNQERRFAEQAESLLETSHKIARDDLKVIESLGVTKLLLRKPAEARALWQSGLALEPRHEPLLGRLAFLSQEQRDLPTAADYFDRLFEVNPWHASWHGRQAHILGQLGKLDRAIQEAKRAIELDPTSQEVHEWLAQIYQMRRESDVSEYHQDMARRLRQAGF